MKKTLVALTVAALAAGTANAAVVYNQDGTKVEVKGSLRVFLHKEASKVGKENSSKRTDLKNDGSRLYIKGSQDLGNGLSAFGQIQLRFDNGAGDNGFGNPKTKHAFGGFKYDGVGALSLGFQATNGDDVQIGDNSYTLGGNNNLVTSGNAIKFTSAEWAGFSFGANYIFGQEDTTAKNKEKNGYGVAAFYNADFGGVGLAFNAGYTHTNFQKVTSLYKEDGTTGIAALKNAGFSNLKVAAADVFSNKTTNDQARLASQVSFGPVTVGAEYGFGTFKSGKAKVKTQSVLANVQYQIIEPTSVYAQYLMDSAKFTKNTAGDKVTGKKVTTKAYLIGADYKFSKNVVAFVEYKRGDTKVQGGSKTKNYEGGLGVRISF